MRFLLCLLPLALLAQPAPEPARVTHAGLLATSSYTWLSDMTIDSAGNVYLAGSTEADNFPATHSARPVANTRDVVVVKFDRLLTKVLYATRIGGSGFDFGEYIAVDDTGTVYVTGYTDSRDLPVTPGGFGDESNPNIQYSVSKLNPDGSFAWTGYLLTSDVRDIAVDPNGRPWVTGGDAQPFFVTTPDAFQPATAGGACYSKPNWFMGGLSLFRCTDAFLVRIAPDGSRIEYATYLGGSGGEYPEELTEPDGDPVTSGSDSARSIAFGPDGSIFLTGYTTSPDFPVTGDALQTEIRAGDAFLTKLSPDGDRIEWSTFLGTEESDAGQRVAIDSRGAPVVLGGTGGAGGFSSTSGVGLDPWASWIARVSADGGRQEVFTKLALSRSLALTEDDTAYVSTHQGDQYWEAVPTGANFLSGITPDGVVLEPPADMRGLGGLLAYRGRGVFYMAGVDSNFAGAAANAVQTVVGAGNSTIGAARIDGTGGQPGYIERIENAASRAAASIFEQTNVSPGEAFTIMGDSLGPAPGVVGYPDEAGFLPTELGGTRVLLDDVALPLYYVSAGQINAFAPFGLEVGGRARVVVERDGRRFGFFDLQVVAANPGVFTGDFTGRGQTVMDNEDGTLNAWDNPAAGGSVVTFFATGLGATEPAMEDGRVSAEETAAALRAEVSVSMGDLPAELVSVEPAPGHAAGVWRIRARVPVGLAASGGHWVYVHAGDGVRSQPFATISVE